MKNYGVSDKLLNELAEIETAKRECERKINEEALKNVGVKPGEIMVNKYTGLHYQITGFRAYVNIPGHVKISVDAYRYYKSGRRAGKTARSSSWINFEDLEKVE